MAHELLAIGLMSGTSADAIDAVLVRTDGVGKPHLLAAREEPLPDELRARILAFNEPGENEIDRMGYLDRELGERFAAAAIAVRGEAGIPPGEVAVIGSHGQTLRHRPPHFSLQIGSPFVIAARTGCTTIADFRTADLVRGGEGAPLVPLFHRHLFQEPGKRVAVVNLGGIANITALPADPDAPLIAGDTGPANALMNLTIHRATGGRLHHDPEGSHAAAGQCHRPGLDWLMSHPYLGRPFPKSTGRESFGPALLQEFTERFGDPGLESMLATLAHFTVASVAAACRTALPPAPERLIVCGGGGRNPFLMRLFSQALPQTEVRLADSLGVNADTLEAQAFAWFAVRTLRGLPSSSREATGASEAAILGAIIPGGPTAVRS
ncbi:MAG: anhydro-N-acetylmuramic acid kinase [Magnetococcales bacterium]|nr:anhydro-N-acetylmuramic acid kinase [Magnetococcales bacterium]